MSGDLWPGGEAQRYVGVPLDRFVRLIEGEAKPRVVERKRIRLSPKSGR